jgi:phage tail-like protein
MAGGRTPPAAHLAAKYTLTVDGVETAVFSELVELSSGLDPSDLAPGLDQKGKATRKRLHAERTPGTVTLRRGQTNDLRLFEWHHESSGRPAARRNAVLIAFSVQGAPLAKYELESAWPAKIEVSAEPTAAASQLLWETVTLTCEEIQRVSP